MHLQNSSLLELQSVLQHLSRFHPREKLEPVFEGVMLTATPNQLCALSTVL